MPQPAGMVDLTASDEVGRKPEPPCPTCGGASYTWGTLAAQGIHFAPDDTPALARFFRFGTRVRARRCDLCGNLQMFARTRDTP